MQLLLFQLIFNGVVNGFIYSVLALSFALVLSVGKIWHFAHAGIISLAAFMLFLFYNMLGMPVILSFLISVLIMGVIGFIIDRFAYQPLRQKNSDMLIFFIVSLMITIFLENLLSIIFGSQNRVLTSNPQKTYDLNLFNVTSWDIKVMISCLILIILFFILVKKTKLGHALIAVATNPEMAETVGIKSKNIYSMAVIISAILTVPIAFLLGERMGVSPTMGFDVLMVAVVATVVGGIGSYTGAVIAGFLIGIVESVGIWQISSEWQSAIVFTILFLCIIFRPSGIMGYKSSTGV